MWHWIAVGVTVVRPRVAKVGVIFAAIIIPGILVQGNFVVWGGVPDEHLGEPVGLLGTYLGQRGSLLLVQCTKRQLGLSLLVWV